MDIAQTEILWKIDIDASVSPMDVEAALAEGLGPEPGSASSAMLHRIDTYDSKTTIFLTADQQVADSIVSALSTRWGARAVISTVPLSEKQQLPPGAIGLPS